MTGRLIEADKLKVIEYTDEAETAISKDQAFNRGCQAVFRLIRSAPTVEAIPISFIKELIDLSRKAGADRHAESLEILLADWSERKEK